MLLPRFGLLPRMCRLLPRVHRLLHGRVTEKKIRFSVSRIGSHFSVSTADPFWLYKGKDNEFLAGLQASVLAS